MARAAVQPDLPLSARPPLLPDWSPSSLAAGRALSSVPHRTPTRLCWQEALPESQKSKDENCPDQPDHQWKEHDGFRPSPGGIRSATPVETVGETHDSRP